MGRKSKSRRFRQERQSEVTPFIKRREVRYGFGITIAFTMLTAILFLSNRTLWLAPERIVTVYRVHGCRCAFQWKRELESEGFSVVMNEVHSLKFIRQRLRTPSTARGCHVGEFLGYFVESHVEPAALRQLSRRHPTAVGLLTETSTNADLQHVDVVSDANSRVLLVGPNAETSVWYRPRTPKHETEPTGNSP